MHIGELTGLPKLRPSWTAAGWQKDGSWMAESNRGFVDFSVEVMLKHFYASRVDGYFPFKISMQLYEKQREKGVTYHSTINMSGAELISDRQVSWRYFVVFLQLYKKLYKKIGDDGLAALFS